MKFEYLANRVEIMLALRQESGFVKDDTHITIAVDGSGHVSVVGATGFEEYRRRVDILVEELEVARWQRVGPEDSEPFLTEEWMDRTWQLRAPLSNGRGWERLPLPESLSPPTNPQPQEVSDADSAGEGRIGGSEA